MIKGDFSYLLTKLEVNGRKYHYYDVTKLEALDRLPYSLRVILECAVRKYDSSSSSSNDNVINEVWGPVIRKLLRRERNDEDENILFHPGRVLLQDFTGVPALIDLAAIRQLVQERGGDPSTVDSKCPADLVVDHSVQVDFSQISACVSKQKQLQPQQQQQQQQQNFVQQPTIILHSTFPPPCTCHQPPLHHNQQQQQQQNQYTPPLFSVPTFYPLSQYQAVPTQNTPPRTQNNNNNQSTVVAVPNDNPGLPIQDEICPFHQRVSHWAEALGKNQEAEFERNRERFHFLKWVNNSFKNITVIPPGTGIMHQVNLEYLARVVTCQGGLLFPDSVVGTDTHTTMINGLGVLGWGVGTLDAQAVMFGHPVTLSLPEVVGVKICGKISDYSTSTDVVLMITKRLRQANVNGKFVEFLGSGLKELSIADRATIANMCPEYGALVGFFPTDQTTIDYLAQTGRDQSQVQTIETYLKKVKMFRKSDAADEMIEFSSIIEIDLSDVKPCVSGPKRTKDKVSVSEIASDFKKSLTNPIGPKGYGLSPEEVHMTFSINIDGALHNIAHGSVLLAAISSCTNTSNPSVMLGAGILARKAVEAGLSVPKVVKTSLAPGSGVVTSYLHESGVMPYLYMLGFEVVGYGCSICVNNSSCPLLPDSIVDAIKRGNLVCCGLLSGNRNFEGRLHSDIKANYLASPLLVIAYALAGTININLDKDPLGFSSLDGKPVFLRDIWPSRQEIQEVERRFVIPAIFRQVYSRVSYGNKHWDSIQVPHSRELFPWDESSTYIKFPAYVKEQLKSKNNCNSSKYRCLLKLGDDITSDIISPAGSIARASPAADYLSSQGLVPREYNSYGSRRGNYHVMMRGTFSNIRLKNLLVNKTGPYTLFLPSGVQTTIFDAAMQYKKDGVPLLVFAGRNFGRGTSRDWATRGPHLLGVKLIVAVSFDPTYRANLVKTGVLPLVISPEDYNSVTGKELFEIEIENLATPKSSARIRTADGKVNISAMTRLDNSYEVKIYKDGGVIAQMLKST